MKRFSYFLLFWVALLSACSSIDQSQPTDVQVNPSQILSITSTPKLAPSTSASLPTDTTALPSSTPMNTITPCPTDPPAGLFAIKFYPPLVLDYPIDQWIDKSEYTNVGMMVNFLQNRNLKTCTISPRGPSGFYPENMEKITLGNICYEALLDQKTTTGQTNSVYFAMSDSAGKIETESGIPIFDVLSSPEEAKTCRTMAEEVLSTLHRSDIPR